jgi:hypothetical protein
MAKTKHHSKRRENNRVLGIGQDIRDIKLVADNRPLLVVIGGTVLDARITRTIAGASNIQITVHDPERKLLRNKILEEKWSVDIDGLKFRYKGKSKAGPDITLKFIEENAARLQEVMGTRKAYRDQVTRAEFILSEVREAKGPEIPVRIFELHKDQPIKHEKERQTKKEERNESGEEHTQGEPGLGQADVGNITLKHVKATAPQVHILDTVLETGMSMGVSFKLLVCSVMTVTQESDAEDLNIKSGPNGEGYGPFSQTAEWRNAGYPGGVHGDVVQCARGFFQVASRVDKAHPDMAKGPLCQEVQHAGAGQLYSQWEDESTKTVETYLGGADVGSVEQTVKERYAFEREKKESAWTNAKELAKEVQWRRFMVAGNFFYVPDTFLMRGKKRANIDEDDSGIDTIDFEDHENLEVMEATVSCRAPYWKVPPGCIVQLNKKMGSAQGLYLVTTIEASLFDSDPNITVKIHKPVQPLKEPAPSTHTNSISVPGSGNAELAGAPQKVVEIIEWIDEATDKGTNYLGGGGHGSFGTPESEKDCSGFVSAAVHAAGYLSHPISSAEFASVFDSGPGDWVTIYGDSKHVFLKVKYPDGHWRFAGTGGPTGSGGWVPESNATSGAAGIGSKVASHPPGL